MHCSQLRPASWQRRGLAGHGEQRCDKARVMLLRYCRSTFSAFTAFALICGCSVSNSIDYSKVTLAQVSGTVTIDGQPLAGTVITFEDPANGNFSFARTDSSGKYTLQFDSDVDGVTHGKKIVRLSTTRNILGLRGEESREEGEQPSENGEKAREEAVPDCYNKDSKLTVEVTGSADFSFDLKSDCSTTGARTN
ncbi:MAG: carboxypeptidase-like regulatory domain-containing protein [Planctomyces sp.]